MFISKQVNCEFHKISGFDKDQISLHEPEIHKAIILSNLLFKKIKKYNGFIAGGFARLLYSLKFLNLPYDYMGFGNYSTLQVSQLHYLNVDTCFIKHQSSKFSRGDIDIYFRTKLEFDMFCDDFMKSFDLGVKNQYNVEDSLTGAAINIYVMNRIKFQVMKCWFGTPEEIMSDFDLLNSKAAFDLNSNCFIVDERLDAYENKRQLHVDKCYSVYTIKRLMNYKFVWNYKSISPETSEKITKKAPDFILNLRKNPRMYKDVHYYSLDLVKKYFNIAELLRSEDIIFLSSIFNDFGYAHIINELINRQQL